MLIEFKVANFQCFRDTATLSMVPAGQDQSLPGNIWEGNRHRTLKSAAIFGPNASGKTSLLHALYVLRRFVVGSATRMTVGDRIEGVDPFRLSAITRDKPSSFETHVELNGHGYRYAIEASRERVWKEKLEYQDAAERSRWLALIDRDATRGDTVLHERLGSQARRDQIVEDTRDNALILSRAAERNVEAVLPVFHWFQRRVLHLTERAGTRSNALLANAAREAAKNEPYRQQIIQLLRDADTGIIGLNTRKVTRDFPGFAVESDTPLSPEQRAAVSAAQDAIRQLLETLGTKQGEAPAFEFSAEHRGAEDTPVRFGLEDESSGTIQYLALIGWLLHYCEHSCLVAIDELDASLHPQLSRRIVQLIHSPAFSRTGTQLVFSTHDITLMDPTLLRRDQIMLTQKDATGASDLYSLWDFENTPRQNSAWQKNYFAGRFGGVPVFGPMLADIPQADEPTIIQPLADAVVSPE